MENIPIRMPAPYKRISELRASDERVKVIGLVVDRGSSDLVLDDGSGQITAILEDPAAIGGVDVGSRVRVFGSPMEAEGGLELQADILQRVDPLDVQIHEQVREEWKKQEARLRGE